MIHPIDVLLVEDDAEIRQLMTRFLPADTYRLCEADGVPAALEALAGTNDFAVAIVDFWLNGETAVPILDEIARSHRALPIVMISGGDDRLDLEMTQAVSEINGAVAFVQKPFSRATLLAAVAAASQGR